MHRKVETCYIFSSYLSAASYCTGNNAMSSEVFSVIVRCWYDPQSGITQVRVVRVDTAKEVHLSDSSFLLRISADGNAPFKRCFIRHLTSGREAYIQGGPNLLTFIKDCLLKTSAPESPSANASGK